jgi:ABC-type lipoprotein release transport system permease subunit
MISWEVAGGQYWHEEYDPYDPFTLTDSHGQVPVALQGGVEEGAVVPLLITQGSVYPRGMMHAVLIKGIPPQQKVTELPSSFLAAPDGEVHALIGKSMAESTGLKEGDYVTIRWRDRNGTFDATEVKIAAVFETTVPTVDVGQIWLPLDKLQDMMLMPGEATILIRAVESGPPLTADGWTFKDQDFLLSDIEMIIKAKGSVGLIIWAILLLMAMLAVFDTQVLSIFRRQKEIGTYVALGMTKSQVVGLFTLEGAMNSILAAIVGAIYGIPLLLVQAIKGISIPLSSSDFGIAMAERLYPVYSLWLITGTVVIVLLVTTAVSYWPSRRIAKMSPTEALRGRIQ